MLLNPDTARVSVQKLHPITHKEYFLNRQIDQLSTNSNYQGQDNNNNISNDTDDMSVGDINEITFSVLIDDGNNNNDDDVEDDDDDDDEDYEDEDGEQEESDEEKRVNLIIVIQFDFFSSLIDMRDKLY
jgi:TATA-binding protein-associated factor Taf7